MKKKGGLSLPAIILIVFGVIAVILLFYFLYPSIINLTKNSLNSEKGMSEANNSLAKNNYLTNSSELANNTNGSSQEITATEKQAPSSKILNFVASNNPNDYLGDYIGYESPSDWKNYQPMIDEVNQLTKGLSADRRKAYAIGDWVKHSREYNSSLSQQIVNPTNWTIIDLFNAQGGVCIDSAYLTVAMLRIAGISSRAVAPASGPAHEQVEVYVDNDWYTMDSTYGADELYFLDQFDVLLRYADEYVGFYNKENEYYLIGYSITQNNSGFVEYPIISNEKQNEWYMQLSGEPLYANYAFLCKLKQDGEYIYSPDYYVVNAQYFGDNYRDKSKTFTPPSGFLKSALPFGEYELECSVLASYDIAFADFTITKGKTTAIFPEDLKKEPDAKQKYFDEFIGLLNQSLE